MGKNEVIYIGKEKQSAEVPIEIAKVIYEIKMDSLDASGITMAMPASIPNRTTFKDIVENARGKTEADIKEYTQTFKKGYKETLSAYNRFVEALNEIDQNEEKDYNLSCAGRTVEKEDYIDNYLFKRPASLEGHKELKPIVFSVVIGNGAE